MKKHKTFLIAKRKIIGVLVSAAITTTVITTPILANNFKIGDVNQDKEINSIDLASLRGYLIGIEGFSVIGERNQADVNGDSFINSIDLAFIRQFVLGIINKFPKTNVLPDPTPSAKPFATQTAKPIQTPTRDIAVYTPVKTPAPNYILASPTQHPDKLISRIFISADNLTTSYFNNSVSFKVFLVDNSDNPIADKTVSWNWDPNLGEESSEKLSAVTDSNGVAIFTTTQNFDANIYYEEWNRFINLYFDGDEKYNASVSQKMVLVSNNGLPLGAAIPLPSPVLDPDKVNTNIEIYKGVQTITRGLFSVESTFSIRLVNDKGDPLTAKTVGWTFGNIPASYDVINSAITDSNGVAVFSFSQMGLEDHPYNSKSDRYINLCFEGDDTNNPSVNYTKITIPYMDSSKY